jgi:aspartyl-tRNA(Asn)/glutamyl-tRNA(Gln) amidotransferase subunit C
MHISADQVRHLCSLARLEIASHEASRLRDDLSRILEYVRVLDRAEMREMESAARPMSRRNRLREDVVGEVMPREEALREAPERAGGFFAVPAMVEFVPPERSGGGSESDR